MIKMEMKKDTYLKYDEDDDNHYHYDKNTGLNNDT